MTTWTPEEQKAHRKLWVEALRSGDYKQAKGVLRDQLFGGFCCLGVACQISGLGEWIADGNYVADGYSNYAVMPWPVMGWLGLSDCAGEYDSDSLTSRNDSGATFAQIADIIESEPEYLIVTPVKV